MNNNAAVFISSLIAQAQGVIRKPIFKITVKHKSGMELAVKEEKRRKKIKSLQRKNKRNKRR